MQSNKLTLLPATSLLRALAVCLAAAAVLSACNSAAPVSVHKSEPSIKKHAYDKDNRPAQEVGKHPSVEANTHWDYRIIPEITVQRTQLKPNAQGFEATVLVKSISVELALPIEMWVPEGVSDRVVAHEEGHIRICKHFYADAQNVALECANSAIGHTYEGVGKDANEATERAIEFASSELCACYQRKIIEPTNRASATYDSLTNHGQNSTDITEAVDKAIDSAVSSR
jgi:hypothetical protein